MTTLAIDRATDFPGVAIESDGKIKSVLLAGVDARSGDWALKIREFLFSEGLSFSSVDRYIVGLGPGSFAGTRSALAFVQGLALPEGKPVYGLPSPVSMAGGKGRITVVGDARRRLFWTVTYDGFKEVSPLRLVEEGELLSAAGDGAVRTPDGARIAPVLSRIFNGRFEWSEELRTGFNAPSAGLLAKAALEVPEALVRDPLPVYLSPAVRGPETAQNPNGGK